jgi:release factor glutamine methyltransferase
MKTLLDVLKLATEYLTSKHIAKPRLSAEELLAHTLGLSSRLDLYMQFDRPLEEKELQDYRALIKRSAAHEPYAYIVGSLEFYGCNLLIDKRALIPRSETELLLNLAIKRLSGAPLQGLVAWDLCTGSGCLGLGLKKAFPELSVTLSDISEEALALAKENAVLNQLDVTCVQGDLLNPFCGQKADIILCNPPYVSSTEFKGLDPSVATYEPTLALKAQGEKGEAFYERLSRELSSHLNLGAYLFLEIGKDQGECVTTLFQKPYFAEQRVEKDLAGHDRFFYARFLN